MSKRNIYLVVFVIFIVFVVVLIVVAQSSLKSKSSPALTTNNSLSSDNSSSFPSVAESGNSHTQSQLPVSSAPEHLTPEEVARKFYSWYLTYSGVSALSSGAYKTSPYLTEKFKETITYFAPYDPQYDPVFCTPNKLANFTVQSSTTTSGGERLVVVNSAPDGQRLYNIIIKNVNGRWLIDDTRCM